MKTCKFCKEHFKPTNTRQIFCSKECREKQNEKLKKWRNEGKEEKKRLKELAKLERVADIFILEKVTELINKSYNYGIMINGKYFENTRTLTNGQKYKAYKRDKYMCQICRSKEKIEAHHIIPRNQGGTNETENLLTLCKSCHEAIETKDIEKAAIKCTKNFENSLIQEREEKTK